MDHLGKPEFERIVTQLNATETDVQLGKMMSAPGLKCNGKIFAFHAKDGMGFRLGPEFDPETSGLQRIAPLNPFKTKGPLKGWFMVDAGEARAWEILSMRALAFTRTLSS